MAGRSSQADNRGSSLFGLLASGKGRKFHTFRDAASASDPTGHTATGGVISDYTDPGPGTVYRSHVFTTTGTFNVTALDDNYPSTVEFLLVAGGGGGGTSNNGAHGGNGGGGGGGYVEGNAIPVTSTTTFTVSIGGGGQAIGQPTLIPAPSRSGSDSTISGPTITTITAKGGGGGGEDGGDTVSPGGSGGGSWGGGGQGPTTFGSATQPGTNSLYGATDYGNAGGKRPGLALHIVDLVEVVPVVPVEMLVPQALVELVVMEEHLLLHMDQQIRYLMQVVVVAVTLHMVVIMQVPHLVEVVLLVPEEGLQLVEAVVEIQLVHLLPIVVVLV